MRKVNNKPFTHSKNYSCIYDRFELSPSEKHSRVSNKNVPIVSWYEVSTQLCHSRMKMILSLCNNALLVMRSFVYVHLVFLLRFFACLDVTMKKKSS